MPCDCFAHKSLDILPGLRILSDLGSSTDNLLEGEARFYELGADGVNLAETAIANHQAVRGVPHDEAIGHRFYGTVEHFVRLLPLGLYLLPLVLRTLQCCR